LEGRREIARDVGSIPISSTNYGFCRPSTCFGSDFTFRTVEPPI